MNTAWWSCHHALIRDKTMGMKEETTGQERKGKELNGVELKEKDGDIDIDRDKGKDKIKDKTKMKERRTDKRGMELKD